MANQYKQFLNVLKKWPVDPSKSGRDIAVYIQEEVKKAFSRGVLSATDEAKCARALGSLRRLGDNVYGQKYKRSSTSSSTGLNREQCHGIMSTEFLDELNKHNTKSSWFSKTKNMHVPVLSKSVIEILQPQKGQTFVDMTFGAGGHTKYILNSAPDTKVFALDRDPVAYKIAENLAACYPGRVIPLLGKFSDLPKLLQSYNIRPNSIDGILFDLGCSSMQFDEAYRGFSVSKDGPLDMRMDGNRIPNSVTAADVLAKIEEHDLARILTVYGEEKQAKKIARSIIETRYTFKILQTTRQLAEFIATILDTETRMDKLSRPAHVATKTFQALRIFVNNELNELNYGMIVAHNYMKPGGTIVTLAFHSLEDRIVKCHMNENMNFNAKKLMGLKSADHNYWCDEKELASLKSDIWKPLLKHVLAPSSEEIEENPRSRSAKLRAAIKIK